MNRRFFVTRSGRMYALVAGQFYHFETDPVLEGNDWFPSTRSPEEVITDTRTKEVKDETDFTPTARFKFRNQFGATIFARNNEN